MSHGELQDSAVLGGKLHVGHVELATLRALSEEELHIEKKLIRKIDSLILPMVVLVYLMNYIDRYTHSLLSSSLKQRLHVLLSP
jgi:hypothetical protein